VDAICKWEPHIINARKLLGKQALILPVVDIYREDFYFVANSPETLKRFLKAIEKGEEFIQKDREGAINIVSERLKLDKELTVLIWDEFNFRLVLDQSIIISLEDEARWAIREELVDEEEVPDYLDFIYIDALEEVKPEAVTIIR